MEVGCSSRFSVLGDGLNTAWRLRTRLSDCGADASEAYENGEKDSQFELPLDAFNAIELSSFAWINVVGTFSAATEHPHSGKTPCASPDGLCHVRARDRTARTTTLR
jgi:hypothetical protein